MDKREMDYAEIRAILAEVAEMSKENERKIDKFNQGMEELRKELGGVGESNGRFTEAYFYSSLFDSMRFGGVDFDEVEKGVKRSQKTPDGKKLKTEFDVVMYNGDTIALIEVKYRVRKEHIANLVEKQVGNFKRIYPHFSNYRFYLGIAGMSFEDEAENEALKNGVGMLRPKGENVEILDENLKAY